MTNHRPFSAAARSESAATYI